MCCSLFWGLFLVLFGASIILNIALGISVPVFKVFLAIFLIYLGIRMLVPSSCRSVWSCRTWRSEKSGCLYEKVSSEGDAYTLRFGKSTIDLTSLNDLKEPKTVTVEVQFADATVVLPKNVPVHVKANVSFGAVNLPGKPMNSEYTNLHGAQEPLLTVLIESAFANVVVQG